MATILLLLRRARLIILLVLPFSGSQCLWGEERQEVEEVKQAQESRSVESLFRKMEPPRRGEWLDVHYEPGQSFQEYVDSHPNRPTEDRHTMVISVLGKVSPKERALVKPLMEYITAFFQLPVRQGEDLPLNGVTRRINSFTNQTQFLAPHILDRVLRPALPPDAVSYMGLTFQDLYPEDSWSFVFGMASFKQRVGVYSLIRYFPAMSGEKEGCDARLLRRSIKVMFHEAAHSFGLAHCIRYRCVVNGSNSLEEADRRPPFLCPDCLRKLEWNIAFDVIKRYRDLRALYAKYNLMEEVDWLDRRIVELEGER